MFPILNQSTWFHVGDMKNKAKKSSYEGGGLSVSMVPDSWRRIAKLSGETYQMKKQTGEFLDMICLDIVTRKKIFDWAIERGYLETSELWVYSYYDDEWEQELCTEFNSRKELEEELSWDELEEEERNELEVDIKRVKRYQATKRLMELECWEGSCSSTTAEDFAIVRYADEVLGLDGVFWNEEHDVSRLSAPRAVIFQSKVKEWNYTKLVSP